MKTIPLLDKNNQHVGEAIVDDADFDALSAHTWRLSRAVTSDSRYHYAAATINGQAITMHRLIAGAMAGEVVDHKNHNPLDNRRDNLRRCTHAENLRNNRRASLPRSGLKHITYSLRYWQKPWMVRIKKNYKHTAMCFATMTEAVAWRDEQLAVIHGAFAGST